MNKLIAAVAILGVLGLDAALGVFFPKAGLSLNAILLTIGLGGVVAAFVVGKDASMDSSEGFAALALLVSGAVVALLGAFGLGWAWWGMP